jgi:tRNA dimethylallyltransferase
MALATRVVAVVGPTATGKSALAIAIAAAIGGEVVNADSMQLYRGMDIGTAKVSQAERQQIPHHLLDIWPVTHSATAAEYQQRARAVIDELHARSVVPVLVGGSGLYVRAALDRIDFPGTDPDLRTALEAELATVGSAALHGRLAQTDPAAAAAILPTNGRRIVRALEVIELTGRPFTAALPRYDTEQDAMYDVVQIGLDLDDAALDQRVDQRVERMFADGLINEVRTLVDEGLREGRTASRALGYQQVLAALDRGLDDALIEAQAIVATKASTRRFVHRQRSWFRRDPRIRWLDAASPDVVALATAVVRAEN